MPKRDYDKEAAAILAELRTEVNNGLGGKKLSKGADAGLAATFKPKVIKRLKAGGDWNKEKAKPLQVAQHLGQIAAILSVGGEVSVVVAKAAGVAIKHDELCPSRPGAGQWCV